MVSVVAYPLFGRGKLLSFLAVFFFTHNETCYEVCSLVTVTLVAELHMHMLTLRLLKGHWTLSSDG